MSDADEPKKQDQDEEIPEQTVRIPPVTSGDGVDKKSDDVAPDTASGTSGQPDSGEDTGDDSDMTFVRDPDETRLGDMPDMEMLALGGKLVVVSKQDQGQEFYVSHKEMIAGRGRDTDLQLNFAGISRRHFRLVYEGGTLKIEDLGSKFGTVVGGQKITGAVPLRPGTTIQVGELLLRYEQGGSAKTGGVTPGIDFSKMITGMNPLHQKIAVGCFVVVILLLLIWVLKPSPPPVVVTATVPQPVVQAPVSGTATRIETDLEKARQQAEAGHVDQALLIVRGILDIEPGHVEASALDRRFKTQARLSGLIMDARRNKDAGNIEAARETVHQIFEFAPDNHEAREILAQLEQLKETQKDLGRIEEARNLIQEGRYDAAANILATIEDQALQGEVTRLKGQIDKAGEVRERLTDAETLFNEGHLNQSLEVTRTGLRVFPDFKPLKGLELKIENLKKLQVEADKLLGSANPMAARPALTAILELTGSDHPLGVSASGKLRFLDASTVVHAEKKFQKALVHFADGQWREAFELLDQLNADYPGNAHYLEVQNEMRLKIDNMAKAVFRAGYVLEETEPLRAKEIFRRLVQLLPENHPYSRKARNKIRG